MSLGKFFEPKSVAVIGASHSPEKIGYNILENLKISFPGEIYPINPNAEEIMGLKSYPSVLEVEEPIDLAIIAVPSDIVPTVVLECIKKKITAIIIISSGFKEIGEIKKEEELKKIIKDGKKARILGPNCVGIYQKNLDMLFFPRKRLKRPLDGSISFITQSGAYGSALLDLVGEEGVGVSKFISIGNKLDIEESELLRYLDKDLSTRCILMYLESIENGKEFIKTAKKIKKPMVCLKAGRSEKGKKAVMSHTGSLAGDNEIYSTAFKQGGIIEVRSTEELFDFGKALAKQPMLKTNKIAIITDGGGFGVVATDSAHENGLDVVELSKNTIKKISNLLPSYATATNPIDLTGDADSERYTKSLDLVLKDPEVSGVLLVLLMQIPTMTDEIIEALRDAKIHGKPIVVCSTGGAYTMERVRLIERLGIPVYPTPERAIKALSALYKYKELLKKK